MELKYTEIGICEKCVFVHKSIGRNEGAVVFVRSTTPFKAIVADEETWGWHYLDSC